ncbi:glycoside hydrolase family 6 protein [Patellaria atrata CBS 101060]|uniref:Glucanase n=1 Tax=Patellaria atrata CBS 101060 TaxID=1346257 RepID=A0A9P4S8W1_9PEZI|nr:glycoside hydrolase family 6 protein [Patellaria atrata CBS 101060]
MQLTAVLLAALATAVSARPPPTASDVNPFVGKDLYVPKSYAAKLDTTIANFLAKNDTVNAARTRTVQRTSTFTWVTTRAGLVNIDTAIKEAREQKRRTRKETIVGLVLYNLPDRDCSAGESAGELSSAKNGLEIYKKEFIDPYAKKLADAGDLTFAVVLEPDSLGNAVTNQGIEFCKNATTIYEQGIAYAIKQLQLKNVALYIDAAHGGWLGWADNLEPTAKEFAKVLSMAGNSTKIRGFATNVSNYNPYNAIIRENYTEWSPSWDESHYATSLSEKLVAEGLPAHFIIDQGRVALPGAREEWGEWCNVSPAGFGRRPTTQGLNNTVVDALVWIKPGGESDGRCGLEGAPAAGAWFDEYVQMLVKNADPPLTMSLN